MQRSAAFSGLRIAVLLSLLLAGCASGPQTQVAATRLYALDCGSIEALDVSVFHPGIDLRFGK